MVYAPIIIPTCNRLSHLKRCIGSLQNNNWAKHTELYISIDYPPNEKYEKGYPQLCKWLYKKPQGFKAVHIFIQPQNLGPIKNVQFLTDLVSSVHDRFMITEDDNEFAPNFIEYMDKCLEEYKDDNTVLFVCAASELRNVNGGGITTYKSQYFQPYGFATWKDKYQTFLTQKENIVLNPFHASIRAVFKLYRYRNYLFRVYVHGILCGNRKVFWADERQLNPIDGVIQLYLAFHNQYSIFPAIRKARTWGNDGSGFNMKEDTEIDPEKDWPLDLNVGFTIKAAKDNSISECIRREMNQDYKKSQMGQIVKCWMMYILFCILGKNRTRTLRCLSFVKKYVTNA